MSVQVRRRREAAAFLQSFVGAQGELIVETSTNRVQVHDGATPGGWPAARVADLPGRNAVLNGNFAINQRLYVSGAALAAGAYAHDRWKAGSAGCTYAFTQTVPDTTVTISAGSLIQPVDGSNVYAAAYWLSWTGTAQARVWQGASPGAFASSPLLVSTLTPGVLANIEFATGSFGLVQFEAALSNAGPTRFERRQVGAELALCQRYFYSLTGAVFTLQLSGYASAASQNLLNLFSLPVTMRAVPVVNLIGAWTTTNCTAGVLNPTVGSFLVLLSSSGAGFCYAANPANGGISANAEL